MPQFLIEVPHEADTVACARVVQQFLTSGSHFLTHAEWGCKDGQHSGWIIVDMESKEDARSIIPPPFRSQARIIGLNNFTVEQMDAIIDAHRTPS